MPDNAETTAYNRDFWIWGEDESQPRLLHAMFRVKDFAASLRFYVDTMGMTVLDRFDVASRRVTGMFVGYGNYRGSALIELTRKWDDAEHSHGDAFGHIAIGVPDLPAMAARIESAGYELTEPPRVLMDGGPMVAFARDPDGFVIELIQIQIQRG